MEIHLFDLARVAASLIAGGVIGLAFGTLQEAALRRNEQREREGTLKNGWSLMPGAGARVAYLLVALAGVQLICPMLFADGTQWFVSGGLLLGFGSSLWQRLRRRRAQLG
jgi:hypothetical protein